MAVNLSIKNVPDALADRLRARAEANHRSLQGELMALVESALNAPTTAAQTRSEYATTVSVPSPYPSTARASGAESIKQSRAERAERLMDIVESESAYRRARALLGLETPSVAKTRGRRLKRTTSKK